jgi:hypothetical protein
MSIAVHDDDPQFSEIMKRAAQYLGLKGHQVGMLGNKKTIYGPADIGH